MPRNARCVAAGLPYHITQRGSDHQDVFFSIGDRKTYLRLMAENLDEAGVRVLAYCLMTNHVHLVVIPDRADSLSLLMGRVSGRYSQYLNARRNRCGTFGRLAITPARCQSGTCGSPCVTWR